MVLTFPVGVDDLTLPVGVDDLTFPVGVDDRMRRQVLEVLEAW